MSAQSLSDFTFPPIKDAPSGEEERAMTPEQALGASWTNVDDTTYTTLDADGDLTYSTHSGSSDNTAAFNPFSFTDLPQDVLHHTPSTSSLSSLASNNGLFVYPDPDSAFTLAPLAPFDEKPSLQDMDMTIFSSRELPKLEVQTQGLGRTPVRQRSSSRVAPYDRRDRSESISAQSSLDCDDELELLSSTTTHSLYTPWSTNTLAGGLNKMTLHHRRTSSTASVNPTPTLARTRRSTMHLRKSSSTVDFPGSVIEREDAVRRELLSLSEQLRDLPTTSQQDKARSTWVRRWLVLSYTPSIGHTVPRQGLYHSYSISCKEYGIKAINSASFGKAVRSAFPGIKTRRLGVRGNSKYHYVAIRPAVRVEAERLNQYGDSSGQWHVAPEDGSMGFHASADVDFDAEDVDDMDFDEDEVSSAGKSPSPIRTLRSHDRSTSDPFVRPRGAFTRRHTTSVLPTVPSYIPVYNLPGFPSSNGGALVGASLTFWDTFCRHQEELVGFIRGSDYDRYEMNCRTFWSNQSPIVACQPAMSGMILKAMTVTYDHMMAVLMDKLTGPLPKAAELRRLGEQMENTMEDCFKTMSSDFKEPIVELTARVAHLFLRFVDLHQLTVALNPILSNPDQVRDMLAAWDGLNIASLADQCALSGNCEQELVNQLLSDFHLWLEDAQSSARAIDRLGEWIEKAVSDLGTTVKAQVPFRCVSSETDLGRIVPRAGFLTSQVMRDFTLRSEKTFGLFQLVKTWIDDYVAILAVRKTCLCTHAIETATSNPMSVIIPSQSTTSLTDLSTAVPHNLAAPQFFNMPAFDGSLVTPRPFIPDAM